MARGISGLIHRVTDASLPPRAKRASLPSGSDAQTHGASDGVMVWAVFTNTVAGPGFLAGDYVDASGEVTGGTGLGANVLVGGSSRTVALQAVAVSGQIGLNLAVGVAALHLGLLRQQTH
jgi:Protein of unknown function (DUF992)